MKTFKYSLAFLTFASLLFALTIFVFAGEGGDIGGGEEPGRPAYPTLTVITQVMNGDGGTKVASDFSIEVTDNATTTVINGSETGTVLNLVPGPFLVFENLTPGYTNILEGDCNGTVSWGEAKTCVVINRYRWSLEPEPLPQPQLVVRKIVLNDNGGAASSSDFTIVLTDNNGSTTTFFGSEVGETFILPVGNYSVDEIDSPGYTKAFSVDCDGTIDLGEIKTCEVTNDDVVVPTAPIPATPTGGGGGTVFYYDLIINQGAAETTSTAVVLAFNAIGVDEMMVSNNFEFVGGGWEPYAPTKNWILEDGSGAKTVYVRFRSSGGTTGSDSDEIALVGGGQVLGATASCGIYLNEYLKYGDGNDPDEVKKLQQFLNDYFQANLLVTGFFGPATFETVKKFQLVFTEEILKPWVDLGLLPENTATGQVYKTTLRWINMMVCPSLDLPVPKLL